MVVCLAVGWAVLWSLTAWATWRSSVDLQRLSTFGIRSTVEVLGADEGRGIKLGYCRQSLQVRSPRGTTVTVDATGRCADPWSPGDTVRVVIDPADRDRLVAVGDVIGLRQAQALPVVVAGFGAVAAGYPLGLLLRRRRDLSAGRC